MLFAMQGCLYQPEHKVSFWEGLGVDATNVTDDMEEELRFLYMYHLDGISGDRLMNGVAGTHPHKY
jgi:hypothetical protein